jgi:signal transduction histidine kinase
LLFTGLGVLFYRLARMLLRSGISRRERRIAVILLAGFALATPAFLASGINALTLGERSPFYFWLGLDLRYLLLFVPLAFAFVLVRYHAMTAPSPLFIFLIALTSSALVAALSAWAWTLVHPTWPDNGLRPPFLALFAVALMTSVFWSTAARWRSLLGRNLDWEKYSNASLREFNQRIATSTNTGQIPQTMVEALAADLELEQAAIWLPEPDPQVLRLAAQFGERPTALPEAVLLSGGESGVSGRPLRTSETMTQTGGWAATLRQTRGLEVIVPLVNDGKLVGVLGLGKRWDEEIYDDRDLATAELVGQQAALFLVAARYIQELKRVPGRMAEAQDRERLRLARELHDTVQQFLGRLPFYLAVSRNSIPSDPDQAAEMLNQAIEDVAEAAHAVRQIRHNLAPSQLERGLAQSLITLTTRFQQRTGIETTLALDPELDASTNSETRNAIYRVVEQALNNVAAHALANKVDVRLTISDDKVHLIVADNGQGANEAQRQLAQQRGSFGIDSMTARLVSCGGGLSIHSDAGHGLEVSGWVPVVVEPPPAEVPPTAAADGQPGISPTVAAAVDQSAPSSPR